MPRGGARARGSARRRPAAATRRRARPRRGPPSRRSRARPRRPPASRRRRRSPTRRLRTCADASCEREPPPSQHPHGAERERDHERKDARQRGVVARPVRTGALRRPEDAEGRQHDADRELHRILGHAGERSADEDADDGDEHERDAGAERREADASLRASEREHDEGDLEALEQHALEREREAVPVEARALLVQCGARLRRLACEDRRLVVERLVAARAQNRLPQPLQAERQQEAADHEAEDVDRDERQRRPERRDDRRERDGRGREPRERRPPAARDARREHDRERLDELDGAREERRGDEERGGHE